MTVSGVVFSLILFNILFLVLVRKTLWSEKLTHPRKSTPEKNVLIKILSGCICSLKLFSKNCFTIDKFFVDAMEAIVTASFLGQAEKLPYVRLAIRKLDTLKVFLMILWETKSLDNKKYIALSLKLDEVGRNLGGWLGKLLKENSLKN